MEDWKEFLWEMESLLFVVGIGMTFIFLTGWFKHINSTWLKGDRKKVIAFLSAQPFVMFFIIFYAIIHFGTVDVKTDVYYLLMYTSVGMWFLHIHNKLFNRAIDISPFTDGLHRNNLAAVFPVSGGMLSAAFIYACMNMGDGDGWWCVLIPYFLCWGFWFLLSMVYTLVTGVSEKVTVGRNIGTGIRSGVYFAVSGIMIAIMNIGNYITFGQVLKDFLFCWPVLLLFGTALTAELIHGLLTQGNDTGNGVSGIFTFLTVCVYILLAFFLVQFFTPAAVWDILRNGSAYYG